MPRATARARSRPASGSDGANEAARLGIVPPAACGPAAPPRPRRWSGRTRRGRAAGCDTLEVRLSYSERPDPGAVVDRRPRRDGSCAPERRHGTGDPATGTRWRCRSRRCPVGATGPQPADRRRQRAREPRAAAVRRPSRGGPTLTQPFGGIPGARRPSSPRWLLGRLRAGRCRRRWRRSSRRWTVAWRDRAGASVEVQLAVAPDEEQAPGGPRSDVAPFLDSWKAVATGALFLSMPSSGDAAGGLTRRALPLSAHQRPCR